MTRHSRPKTLHRRALALLFVVAIVVPGAGLALGLERSTLSESEKRELASWPSWSWRTTDLATWPARFEAYFNDHFLLRTRLIDWRSAFVWNGLRTSPSDAVIAGKNDWLFYAEDGSLDDWIQTKPFTGDDLDVWRETLVRRRDYLARRGIQFLFVVAPDKQMVYPEYMPDSLHRLRSDYRVDQLLAYLGKTKADIPILDLRPALLSAKQSGPLYRPFDTHWNDHGGLVGYQAIVGAMRRRWPGMTPLQLGDFKASKDNTPSDLAVMVGLTDPGRGALSGLTPLDGHGYKTIFPQWPSPYGEDAVRVTEHRDRSLPRLMMFRDSFAGRLMPYLSEHFSRATYYWQNEFDFDAIEKEHPDVVIQEFVARHFFTWVPSPEIIPE